MAVRPLKLGAPEPLDGLWITVIDYDKRNPCQDESPFSGKVYDLDADGNLITKESVGAKQPSVLCFPRRVTNLRELGGLLDQLGPSQGVILAQPVAAEVRDGTPWLLCSKWIWTDRWATKYDKDPGNLSVQQEAEMAGRGGEILMPAEKVGNTVPLIFWCKESFLRCRFDFLDADLGKSQSLRPTSWEHYRSEANRFLPGLEDTELLIRGSSSSRLFKDGNRVSPVKFGAGHVFFMNEAPLAPDEVNRVNRGIRTACKTLDGLYEERTSQVIDEAGIERTKTEKTFWADPAVFTQSHQVFAGRPSVTDAARKAGYSTGDTPSIFLPGKVYGLFDWTPALGAFEQAVMDSVKARYRDRNPGDDSAKEGDSPRPRGADIPTGGTSRRVRNASSLMNEVLDLKVETRVEIAGGQVLTVAEYWDSDLPEMKCQIPSEFRHSRSMNGKIRRFLGAVELVDFGDAVIHRMTPTEKKKLMPPVCPVSIAEGDPLGVAERKLDNGFNSLFAEAINAVKSRRRFSISRAEEKAARGDRIRKEKIEIRERMQSQISEALKLPEGEAKDRAIKDAVERAKSARKAVGSPDPYRSTALPVPWQKALFASAGLGKTGRTLTGIARLANGFPSFRGILLIPTHRVAADILARAEKVLGPGNVTVWLGLSQDDPLTGDKMCLDLENRVRWTDSGGRGPIYCEGCGYKDMCGMQRQIAEIKVTEPALIIAAHSLMTIEELPGLRRKGVPLDGSKGQIPVDLPICDVLILDESPFAQQRDKLCLSSADMDHDWMPWARVNSKNPKTRTDDIEAAEVLKDFMQEIRRIVTNTQDRRFLDRTVLTNLPPILLNRVIDAAKRFLKEPKLHCKPEELTECLNRKLRVETVVAIANELREWHYRRESETPVSSRLFRFEDHLMLLRPFQIGWQWAALPTLHLDATGNLEIAQRFFRDMELHVPEIRVGTPEGVHVEMAYDFSGSIRKLCPNPDHKDKPEAEPQLRLAREIGRLLAHKAEVYRGKGRGHSGIDGLVCVPLGLEEQLLELGLIPENFRVIHFNGCRGDDRFGGVAYAFVAGRVLPPLIEIEAISGAVYGTTITPRLGGAPSVDESLRLESFGVRMADATGRRLPVEYHPHVETNSVLTQLVHAETDQVIARTRFIRRSERFPLEIQILNPAKIDLSITELKTMHDILHLSPARRLASLGVIPDNWADRQTLLQDEFPTPKALKCAVNRTPKDSAELQRLNDFLNDQKTQVMFEAKVKNKKTGKSAIAAQTPKYKSYIGVCAAIDKKRGEDGGSQSTNGTLGVRPPVGIIPVQIDRTLWRFFRCVYVTVKEAGKAKARSSAVLIQADRTLSADLQEKIWPQANGFSVTLVAETPPLKTADTSNGIVIETAAQGPGALTNPSWTRLPEGSEERKAAKSEWETRADQFFEGLPFEPGILARDLGLYATWSQRVRQRTFARKPGISDKVYGFRVLVFSSTNRVKEDKERQAVCQQIEAALLARIWASEPALSAEETAEEVAA